MIFSYIYIGHRVKGASWWPRFEIAGRRYL